MSDHKRTMVELLLELPGLRQQVAGLNELLLNAGELCIEHEKGSERKEMANLFFELMGCAKCRE